MDDLTILSLPRKVLIGQGSTGALPALLHSEGLARVQLAADASMERLGHVRRLSSLFSSAGLSVESVCILPPGEPTVEGAKAWIREAMAAGKKPDALVVLGGGSAIDTAKLLAAAYTNEAFQSDPTRADRIYNPCLPLVALPTTAGTGAEATPNAILLDGAQKRKVGVVSPALIPPYVVLDAVYTESLPSDLAAATGFDAFAHALESYLSKKSGCACEPFALQAVGMIVENLHKACAKNDAAARQNMLTASFYAGVCLATSSTHLIHAMAYPLSGTFHVGHGKAIAALLLPGLTALLSRRSDGVTRRLHKAAAAAGLPNGEALLAFVAETQRRLSGPVRLSDFGVTKADLPWMAAESYENKRLFDNCPVPFTKEEVEAVFLSAL